MSDKDVIVFNFKFTFDQKRNFRLIVLVGVILGLICVLMTIITATAKPTMTELSFNFEDSADSDTVDVVLDKNGKLYYRIESNHEIDVRIVTDYEVSSWTQKEYHYTKDKEFVYVADNANTYTILIEYGDVDASGTLYYGTSKDNANIVTGWTIGIFVSILGGMFVAITYGTFITMKNEKLERLKK